MVNMNKGTRVNLVPIIDETHTKYIVAIQPATWEPEDMFFEIHLVPDDMDEMDSIAHIYREVMKRHGFKALDPPLLTIKPMKNAENRIHIREESNNE